MSEIDDLVVVAKVTSPYGIKGWVKLTSFTDPIDNILQYSPWLLKTDNEWKVVNVVGSRVHGNSIVAHFEQVNDRDRAALLRGAEIAVNRGNLPQLEGAEHYWSDLIGLNVVNLQQNNFGRVDDVIATGANDVLIVKNADAEERLIPYVWDIYIKSIDLDKGLIVVDWQQDY